MAVKGEPPIVDEKLDLRGTLCPLNFVHTKLKLEEMEPGQVLEVILDDGEPIMNVPRSVKEEGHQVIWVEEMSDGSYRVLIRAGDSQSFSA